ncbi:MAG: thioredoxin family protein [Candidatus Gastranaerophilales bacterium]|nr:thioredoxin family protein [Candidatus Gastranaerophilales bacterium]
MRNWIIVLLIFIMPLSLYAYLDNKASADACKITGNATGIPQAKLIKFSSPMCSECVETTVEVKKAMKNYQGAVLIEEYNVLDNNAKGKNITKDMIKKYKISLVPTLVFVDKEGKTVKKQEGLMKADEIVKILDEIK